MEHDRSEHSVFLAVGAKNTHPEALLRQRTHVLDSWIQSIRRRLKMDQKSETVPFDIHAVCGRVLKLS